MDSENQECCRRSFGASLKDSAMQVLKNPKLATRELRAKRLEVCETCPQYLRDTDQCGQCQCIMSLKASFEAMKCPLDKWPDDH